MTLIVVTHNEQIAARADRIIRLEGWRNMLKLNDSITLARTKFRTRRVRLILSLLVISLVCGVIWFGNFGCQKIQKELGEYFRFLDFTVDIWRIFVIFRAAILIIMTRQPNLLSRQKISIKKMSPRKKPSPKSSITNTSKPRLTTQSKKANNGEKTLKIFTSEIAAKVWYNYLERQKKTPEFDYKNLLEEAKKYNPSKIIDEGYSIFSSPDYIYEGSFRSEDEKQN